jgi:hypothetical protein
MSVYARARCGACLGEWCREGTLCVECAHADLAGRLQRAAELLGDSKRVAVARL